MLFRKANGDLIEINKNECKNDTIYYKKIMNAKCSNNNLLKESNSYTQKILICLLEEALNNSDNQDEDKE
jgi:hypothetical protein